MRSISSRHDSTTKQTRDQYKADTRSRSSRLLIKTKQTLRKVSYKKRAWVLSETEILISSSQHWDNPLSAWLTENYLKSLSSSSLCSGLKCWLILRVAVAAAGPSCLLHKSSSLSTSRVMSLMKRDKSGRNERACAKISWHRLTRIGYEDLETAIIIHMDCCGNSFNRLAMIT